MDRKKYFPFSSSLQMTAVGDGVTAVGDEVTTVGDGVTLLVGVFVLVTHVPQVNLQTSLAGPYVTPSSTPDSVKAQIFDFRASGISVQSLKTSFGMPPFMDRKKYFPPSSSLHPDVGDVTPVGDGVTLLVGVFVLVTVGDRVNFAAEGASVTGFSRSIHF